jgi:hypothetical protein
MEMLYDSGNLPSLVDIPQYQFKLRSARGKVRKKSVVLFQHAVWGRKLFRTVMLRSEDVFLLPVLSPVN